MNAEEKITIELLMKHNIITEYVNLFKNKYFWEPNPEYIGFKNIFLKNESILILDIEDHFSDIPYFVDAIKFEQLFLSEYFSLSPLHKTNRITLDFIIKNNHKSLFADLLKNYIKPRILITFSEKLYDYLTKNFIVELKNDLSEFNFSKGIIEIGNIYYFIYFLGDVGIKNINAKKVNRFMMSSTIFDKYIVDHLNFIRTKTGNFIFPQKPENDSKIRNYLIKNQGNNYFIALPNMNFEKIKNIIIHLEEFDFYDLLLSTFIENEKHDIITKEEYLKLRMKQSSKIIGLNLWDSQLFQYREYLFRLSLLKFYLSIHYPKLTFQYEWEIDKKVIDLKTENYKEALNRFNFFGES